jgi:hypothetical protein
MKVPFSSICVVIKALSSPEVLEAFLEGELRISSACFFRNWAFDWRASFLAEGASSESKC